MEPIQDKLGHWGPSAPESERELGIAHFMRRQRETAGRTENSKGCSAGWATRGKQNRKPGWAINQKVDGGESAAGGGMQIAEKNRPDKDPALN